MPLSLTSGDKGDGFVALIGVDATQYSKIGRWDDSAFDPELNRVNYFGDTPYSDVNGEKRDVDQILEDLGNVQNGIILNSRIASDLKHSVGDTFPLANVNPGGTGSGGDVFFQIVGICSTAPGVGILADFSERPSTSGQIRPLGAALVNNYNLAQYAVDSANAFLLEGSSNSNQEDVVAAIRAHDEVYAVYYLEFFELEEEGFLALGGVPGILTIDFVGSLVIIAFALLVFLEFILTERRQEYALLRAIGATRGQVSKSVVGEFLGIAVISLAIGAIVSLIFSLAFIELSVGHLAIFSVLPYSIYIPLPTIAITVFLVFFFLMIGSLWPSRRASQTRIADVLRNL